MQFAQPGASAPIDFAESVLAEVGVENTDRSSRLGQVFPSGKGRVAAISEVLEADRMALVEAHRQCRIHPNDIVASAPTVGGNPAYEVFACGQVERGSFAENGPQGDQR